MAKPEFISMARAALNFTKKKSTWEVFLRGYASTNQRGSATERDILEGLWKNYPTVDALRNACPMDEVPRWDRENPKVGSGLQNLRSRTGAARDLCKVPDLWDELAFLLRCPDEDHQRRVKNFSLGAREGNPNKRIANMKVGLSTKGADMTMLWGGCEVPVIDLWMLRYLTPMVKELGGQSWGELVRSTLREMRREGFDLDLKGQATPKEFSNVMPASEIDENNATHMAAGNGYVQAFIQGKPQFYGYYRDAAYREAEAEGLPANVWHVATWIELIQSQKYDKDGNAISINRDDYDTWLNNPGDTDTKADKQAVRKSRDFLNTLRLPLPKPYGPSAYRGEEPGTPEWFKEQISLVMRGQTGQTLSTEAALDMLRQIRSKAGAYSDVVELIDQHIDSLEGFGARYIPYIQEEEVRRDPDLCRPGQCYSNAYQSAMENWDFGGDAVSEDIRIVHGRVRMGGGTIDTKYPGWGGHAWVEIEDKVFDPTTGSVIDKERYYELLDPIVDYKLSPLAANFLEIKHNNHGPYHPMTLVMANFENIDDYDWSPKNEILIERPHNLDEDDNFDWVDTRVDLPRMPDWMLNPGDVPLDDPPWLLDDDEWEAFDDEPSHKFDPDREPTEAQKRYYQRGKYPHEGWPLRPEDVVFQNWVHSLQEDLIEFGISSTYKRREGKLFEADPIVTAQEALGLPWETFNEDIVGMYLDGYTTWKAAELIEARISHQPSRHSFTDLSGLSRYAADIEALVS